MGTMKSEIAVTREWMAGARFDGIKRLYGAAQVVEQRGSIRQDYTVAREAAAQFHALLRERFGERRTVTTFGPYTPGQAVVMRRLGIEGIYLGGWATSAKGSVAEDPGPDLAAYPLSQVPEEAAPIVRALLAADKNQTFARARMTEAERAAHPAVDYRPFIIADADTGHGGEAHVRNLVRRFVEVGVPGYHIEDQKPGLKKCGHQGGKVLVPVHEQIQRLNAARFQLDVMGVPGIIVARTDAEAASLLDGKDDERDQPFILGATHTHVPSCKVGALAVLRRFHRLGLEDVNGFELHQVSEGAYAAADAWLDRVGIGAAIAEAVAGLGDSAPTDNAAVTQAVDALSGRFFDTWEAEAGLKTYGEAVAQAMAFHIDEGSTFEVSIEEWLDWSSRASFREARARARSMALNVVWDAELARTPEGFYPIKAGIGYAMARSLAVAPFADLIWMETKTAHLPDAKRFAEAIHARFPGKMLAYNLSPSFNWDTTGMSEEEMAAYPDELGGLGFVFNFITYGGHQLDGLATDEFATALKQDGMLALARLQRKLRLLDSPYRTPQTLVGGPRADAVLAATTGRTATTKAMGKGSTQVQHLVQTEVPVGVLDGWLGRWAELRGVGRTLRARLRPHTPGGDLLALTIVDAADPDGAPVADMVFASIRDRRGHEFLSVRDQNTHDTSLRKKRLMTVLHLFLIHRYESLAVHYVSPTPDNDAQAAGMQRMGIYDEVKTEVGQIIVATIAADRVRALVEPDSPALDALIAGK